MKMIDRQFLSYDGEGVTDEDGNHHYILLQNSEGERITGSSLATEECLDFLLNQAAKYPQRIHVIYGGGYDVTKWLREMPYENQVLLKKNGETFWEGTPSAFGVRKLYVVEYIPNKWFHLKGEDSEGIRRDIKIYDVMTFFQSSFIKALESRNIEVDPLIVSGKASRSDFSYNDLEEISKYCGLELYYLVMLCDALRAEFVEAGLNVYQWHGPGAVANAALSKFKVKQHHAKTPAEIEDAAAGAYYGGRFEHFYAGHFPAKVYVYDINSAYPHFIRQLPELARAMWERVEEFDPNSYGLWYCTYEPDDTEDDFVSPRPLPWRSPAGDIGYPRMVTGGWYHTVEAKYATSVEYGYVLRPGSDIKPFQFVEEMYETRKQWKRERRGGERALKLAMNSLYGKLAQRVGWNEETLEPPKWHQLFWAGFITANTRAMLWEAIKQAPDQIIAVETDSVMSAVPLKLNEGSGLGQWETEHVEWLTYIQSGIYFAGNQHGIMTPGKTKIRGLDAGTLDFAKVTAWLATGCKEPYTVPSHRFIALANPQRAKVGNWITATKSLGLAGGKRLHNVDTCESCQNSIPLSEALHRLEIPEFMGLTESSPHKLPWKAASLGVVEYEEMSTAEDAVIGWEPARRLDAVHKDD